MNTFHDFIDCSKYLIQENYTSAKHLYAYGGSAGGLLMGVIANLNAELYHGIIAAVPFVDVITTMLDDTIPTTGRVAYFKITTDFTGQATSFEILDRSGIAF